VLAIMFTSGEAIDDLARDRRILSGGALGFCFGRVCGRGLCRGLNFFLVDLFLENDLVFCFLSLFHCLLINMTFLRFREDNQSMKRASLSFFRAFQPLSV